LRVAYSDALRAAQQAALPATSVRVMRNPVEAVTWKFTGWMSTLYQGPEHFKLAGDLTVAGLDRLKSELILGDSADN
jgi:hypothetical protein